MQSSMKMHGSPVAIFCLTLSRAEGNPVCLDKTKCHAVVTPITLKAFFARPHVVLVHFGGMDGSIPSYSCHVLTISKLPE